MKKTQLYLFTACCAAGLASGYAAKSLKPRGSASVPRSQEAGTARASAASAEGSDPAAGTTTPGKDAGATASRSKSTETLESLKATPDDGAELYARLALWMVDASEEDIAAYWKHYAQRENRSNDINDLIFINWTRINPQGAVAAAKGTDEAHYAWWAWACHDPKAALGTAIATDPDRVNNVTWGIGEFHAEWMRDHFDEIPENARGNALQGFSKWDDHKDPEATLKFLKEKGLGSNEAVFKVLALRDPWAAYDWIEENGTAATSRYGGSMDLKDTFLKTLGEYHPDVLERIVAQTPSGEMKRKMEEIAFGNLVKTDPNAALKQAQETKGPAIAAERFATVGQTFLHSDPEKAFEMAGKLFEACPAAMGYTTVEYGNGSRSWGGSSNEDVGQFMKALMAKDPARTLDLLPFDEQDRPVSGAFQQLAGEWAQRDLEEYSDWVNALGDGPKRDQGAQMVINQLREQNLHSEAAEWSMSLQPQMRDAYLESVISQWAPSNPEAAREWIEASGLPEDRIARFKSYFPTQP